MIDENKGLLRAYQSLATNNKGVLNIYIVYSYLKLSHKWI